MISNGQTKQTNKDGYIKVYFLQSTGEDSYETETMWCKQVGEYYELANIPIIVKNLSAGDIISVEYDEEENVYYFEDFISFSGNSTVRIHVENVDDIKPFMNEFTSMGCDAEGFRAGNILAIHVPKALDYKIIRQHLVNGCNEDKWGFQESCLSDEHRVQVQ